MNTNILKKRLRRYLKIAKTAAKSQTIQSFIALAAVSDPTIATEVLRFMNELSIPQDMQATVMGLLKIALLIAGIIGRVRAKQDFTR